MSFGKSRKTLTQILRVYSASFIFAFLIFGSNFNALFAQTTAVGDKISEATKISPEQLSASFAEVSKRVEPAVVNIDTKGKVPEIALKNDKPTKMPMILWNFFAVSFRVVLLHSVGSGFIVDKSGYILTNFHVVDDASRITVRLQSGAEYQAKIVGVDELTDLAIMKIETGRDLPFIKFGNSECSANRRLGFGNRFTVRFGSNRDCGNYFANQARNAAG